MKKQTLLNLLNSQKLTTKKTTRKDVINLVASLVEKHIPANAEINGLSLNRSTSGVNLGDVVEVVAKSLFNNPLEKRGCLITRQPLLYTRKPLVQ